MSRKKKPLPVIENITITDIAAEGKAIARWNDMVVFVPYAVPGDVVDLQVTRKKHSYCEARVIKFHEYSTNRTAPKCKHFGVCGGCKWQCLLYEKQLYYKQKQVVDVLTRIGKIPLPEPEPIIGAENIFGYRNKLEFSFSNKRWLTEEEIATLPPKDEEHNDVLTRINRDAVGFHIPGAFDKVLDIQQCYLMDDIQNRVRNSVREYAYDNNLTFFDLREQVGLLRDMVFRTSNSGEIMLTMQFHITDKEEQQQADALMEYLSKNYPELTTIVWVNNLKCNDTIGDLDINIFKGPGFVLEQMEDLQFKVGPKSFYQTNNEQAYKLYKTVREFANLTGKEFVYDLYTGTGTIANFIAHKARKVIGIEYVPEAIEDAKINSELNKIDNTMFLAGDMKDILTQDFIAKHGVPDVIITDPPRAGMHTDVINTILSTNTPKVVYVSCNPATQARDLSLLSVKYKVVKYRSVDMFPHTHHIENVCLLQLCNK